MSADERETFKEAKSQKALALKAEALAVWERGRADGGGSCPLLFLHKGRWTIRCPTCNGQYYVGKDTIGEDHWWHMEVDHQICLLAEVDAKREMLLQNASPGIHSLVQWMEDLDVSGESMLKVAALSIYQPEEVQRRRRRHVVEEQQRALEKQLESQRLAREDNRRVVQAREEEERRVVQAREEEQQRALDAETAEKSELSRAGNTVCPSCRIGFSLYNEERSAHWEHQSWEERAATSSQGKLAWQVALQLGNACASNDFQAWLEASLVRLTHRREVVWDLMMHFRGILSAALNAPLHLEFPVTAANPDIWEWTFERWWPTIVRDLPVRESSCKLSDASKLLLVSITVPPVQEAVPIEIHPRKILGEQFGTAAKRTVADRNRRYVNGVSEIALATLHRLLTAIPRTEVETIVLNCMVDAIDSSTGLDTRECVFSVQINRDDFEKLHLARVDPVACVRNLNAAVPRVRGELLPVRPLVEFDKNDSRLIGATDVLSTLDLRPNLMDLTPTEFESLIQNLFEAIGLDTHQTQASRDGGVDCIAYDSRPIFGGKVVIQAKRYKNVVGVSAVRDLWGTVMNEGAGKGILVTTSGYGKASYAFAQGKPLELLEGSHLLHLLKEHTGIDARIIVPDTWVDLQTDM
ncbi:restriction endonuclease [Cryobacterium sp. MDB2-33-2]|uniref:restriction endonuclease n=1 Tax=Cryobacterium sp. MDB2-33-2 TaxID=1259179 RepID=UPI00141BB1FC|nr:restriction endonuclease [Cryobacterium sp. MDB2-33-2]